MERRQQLPLETRIEARIPSILDEIQQSGLEQGGSVDQVKSVLPRYGKPDVIEKIFGKGLPRTNGRTVLTQEHIVQLFVHRDFGGELRTPRHKRTVEKIVRRSIQRQQR